MGLLAQVTIASGPGLDLSLSHALNPREGVGRMEQDGVECDEPQSLFLTCAL